jgi:hypothetical protein
VLADSVQSLPGPHVLPVLDGVEPRPALHPVDGGAGRVEDAADGVGDFGPDAVAGGEDDLVSAHEGHYLPRVPWPHTP